MLKYLSFLLLFLPLFVTAQDKVELVEEKTDKGITLKGVNHFTDQSVELILTINSVGFGLKKEETFTKVIAANSELVIVDLVATPNRQCSYSASMSYTTTRKPAKPGEQKKVAAGNSKPAGNKQAGKATIAAREKKNPLDGKKGIAVYSKDGGGRCDYVAKYLKDNKIPFEYLNISTDVAADKQMAEVLFANGFKGGSFTTPVVTVDDKMYYNIKDLKSFMAGLKK